MVDARLWSRSDRHSRLRPGTWLDAQGGGVAYREPPSDVTHSEVVTLPFDIETPLARRVGEPYNFRGILAFWLRIRWKPRGLFCSQAILRACAEAGHAVVDEADEDEVDPQRCYLLLKAYLRGLNRGR